MSGAVRAVQAAFVAALTGHAGFGDVVTGVFDGPPRRADFPYAMIADTVWTDWSVKDAPGCEIRMGIAVLDEGNSPLRVNHLLDAAMDAIDGLARDLDGWRVASLVFVRARSLQTARGPWHGLVEYRVRVMAV